MDMPVRAGANKALLLPLPPSLCQLREKGSLSSRHPHRPHIPCKRPEREEDHHPAQTWRRPQPGLYGLQSRRPRPVPPPPLGPLQSRRRILESPGMPTSATMTDTRQRASLDIGSGSVPRGASTPVPTQCQWRLPCDGQVVGRVGGPHQQTSDPPTNWADPGHVGWAAQPHRERLRRNLPHPHSVDRVA